MNNEALQKCFMLFLQIMPDEELVSYAQFISKIEEKEHDQAFRNLLEDFLKKEHKPENETAECITLFRELLK